ncbi:hypothetical protein ACYULU_13820 [Breznakiellaceae bacterium SP9]
MTNTKKLVVCILCIFLVNVGLGAQQNQAPHWFTLEKGKRYFRIGQYGNALMCFEDARRERKEHYTTMQKDLIDFLSIPEVRRLDYNLDQIEAYIADKYQPKAATVLKEVYYTVPRQKLQGSVKQVLNELERLLDYPEAEYWIGEVYRMEGELELALIQYQKAVDKSSLLENPDFELDIIYKMFDIYRIQLHNASIEKQALQLYSNMEKQAQKIFTHDTISFDKPGPYNWNVMVSILNKQDDDGINQFLRLYRYTNRVTEKAHRLLGIQNQDDGKPNVSEHLLFAFLIQNSVLIAELRQSDPDFVFDTVDTLIDAAYALPQLTQYIEEVDYFKTLFYFAESLFPKNYNPNDLREKGSIRASLTIWAVLSRHSEAGEWMVRAQRRIAQVQ